MHYSRKIVCVRRTNLRVKFRSTQDEVCLEEKRIRRRMENAPGEERFSINLHERPCFIRFQLLQTVGEVLDKSEEPDIFL